MATEACVIIHAATPSDCMPRIKAMHRHLSPSHSSPICSSKAKTAMLMKACSAPNITDGSCSEPSETDAGRMDGERKTTRKRSLRKMTKIVLSGNRDCEGASRESNEVANTDMDCEVTARAQQDSGATDDDFEYALTWYRNNRVIFQRLGESAPMGKLSMINLTRRGIGYDQALLIYEAIRLNPFLSVVKLSYNELGDAGTSVIAKAFIQGTNRHKNLSVLDLGFNEVGDSGCEALALMAIAGNPHISSIYLSGNRIKEKGALAIAAAVLHGSGLSVLHLTANNIGSSGVKAIAGAIAKHDAFVVELIQQGRRGNEMMVPPALTELHISNTGMDSTGFIAVPGMMCSNAFMKVLALSNNNINDQDMMLLSQALAQNKTVPLEKLELSFNEITDQGVECLMNALWGSEFLRVIKLDNNRLQDRGAQLCAVVLTSIALTVLDLGFNRVTTTGIKALMKNVSESNSLHTLGLSGIPIDQNASKALAYALAYNSSMATLHLDSCSMGYAAQRHIVAGIISNRRLSLRVLTGFPITQIVMTLGIPRLPEKWSNVQVLGFVRLMWQQWNLKSGNGCIPSDDGALRGPAPPASIVAAAKIALTSLGGSPENMFKAQSLERPFTEGPPVDPLGTALLERSPSGTLTIPTFSQSVDGEFSEWVDEENHAPTVAEDSRVAMTVSPLEDPVRRNKNLKWLKLHFRSLSEVGRLPFNNADLWQLHQYFFSPPIAQGVEGENHVDEDLHVGEKHVDEDPPETKSNVCVPQNSPIHKLDVIPMSRPVSFASLTAAFVSSGLTEWKNRQKRSQEGTNEEHNAKRAKSLKTRIGFYPRIMTKIQSTGSRPMDQTLSLLRQLKYLENAIFEVGNPYESTEAKNDLRQDIEMILLDLL